MTIETNPITIFRALLNGLDSNSEPENINSTNNAIHTLNQVEIIDIRDETFNVAGAAIVFDANFSDIETFKSFAFFVTNNTTTVNINRIQLRIAEDTNGGGNVVDGAIVSIPGSFDPDNFYIDGTGLQAGVIVSSFDAYHCFRSISLGIGLIGPFTQQSITVKYKGIRY
jgi:hypothetical protein